ncbi:MAG: succinate dehydrogenase, cytochrome b556 subunit [Alphaproteobacteria bacterium]
MQQNKKYRERPLSPHLTIYRWQISNSLSILHRITGIGLYIGMLLLAWWLVFLIYSSFDPSIANLKCLDCFLGKLVLLGFTAAFFYHLLTGVRHLFWDAGYGFDKTTMNVSGFFVLIGTIILTVGAWLIAFNFG